MQYTQHLMLDVFKQEQFQYIHAKQFDHYARQLVITPTVDGEPLTIPETATAVFRCLKHDGTSVVNPATVDAEAGTITFELTDQALACEGMARADVSIIDGESIISTLTFFILVDKAATSNEQIASANEFLFIVQAAAEVEANAKAAVEAARHAAASETVAANAATAAAGSATTAQNNATEATRAMQEATKASSDAITSRIEVKAAQTAAEQAKVEAEAARDEALAGGKADEKVAQHNVAVNSHSDIRLLISNLITRLNALANSTDPELDQMSEMVAYIKDNRELIEQITTGKVSVSDIINNLTTNVSNKPLSAAQGVALKGLIDTLQTAVNGKAGKAITLAGYGITDGATKTYVDNFEQRLSDDLRDLSDYVRSLSGEIANQQTAIEELQEALRVNPILGSIDENNNIILVGTLADGEYTLKYEYNDDYIEIGTLVVGAGEPIEAPDTTIVFEKGTKIDSSTGAETTGNAGYSASNYISIVEGFKYTVYKKSSISEGLKVCYYDASKNFISTSGDVIVATTSQATAVIPMIEGASFFRLRVYGTASLISESDWEVIAEVSS